MPKFPDSPRCYILPGEMPDPSTRLPLSADGAVKGPAGRHTAVAKVAAAATSLAALPVEHSFDEQLLETISTLFGADSVAVVTRMDAFDLQVSSGRSREGFMYVPARSVNQALDEHAAVAIPWVAIPRGNPHEPAGCAFLCAPIGPPGAHTCVVCQRTSSEEFTEDDVHALVAFVQLAESLKDMSRRLDTCERLRKAERDGRRPEMMFFGDSPASRPLTRLMAKIAPINASVLISGEPGTGKEVVGRAIHEASGRSDAPFVVADCRQPATLLEVTLWGAARGTYTGSPPIGCAELARGGTLFVDAVEAMPLASQGKFLRLLQEHEIQRVGSTSAVHVDVRVIAATSADLKRSVDQGTFREDLYYRLNVIPLQVLPLRERRTEITSLARSFLERSKRERPLTISEAALRCLVDYDWPGNMRELEQVIARAAMVALTDRIEPEDLPEALREDPTSVGAWAEADSLHRVVLRAKVQRVSEAWRTARGVHTEAARALGISEGYFRRLLRQFGFDEEPPMMGVRTRK